MLERLRAFIKGKSNEEQPSDDPVREPAPKELVVAGLPPLPVERIFRKHEEFPLLDQEEVDRWIEKAEPDNRALAWIACGRAWLFHFRDALGPTFHLAESENAIVLSSLSPRLAQVSLNYMERTLKRVLNVLGGLAEVAPWGKDVLIIFDDEDTYYRYVTYYGSQDSEFSFSSGMFISQGCLHYVTVKNDMQSVEPVIAHEMTHGALAHLSLPAWVNEGLAVNVERRIAFTGRSRDTPQEMHARHQAFWNKDTIQHFWSGRSFHRNDESRLAYDLARIMVELMGKEWHTFVPFAQAADWRDAGDRAAQEYLDIRLGAYLCALLEKEYEKGWEPAPARWEEKY